MSRIRNNAGTNDKIQSLDTALTSFKQRIIQQSRDRITATRNDLLASRRAGIRSFNITDDDKLPLHASREVLRGLIKTTISDNLNVPTVTPPQPTTTTSSQRVGGLYSKKKRISVNKMQDTTPPPPSIPNTTLPVPFPPEFERLTDAEWDDIVESVLKELEGENSEFYDNFTENEQNCSSNNIPLTTSFSHTTPRRCHQNLYIPHPSTPNTPFYNATPLPLDHNYREIGCIEEIPYNFQEELANIDDMAFQDEYMVEMAFQQQEKEHLQRLTHICSDYAQTLQKSRFLHYNLEQFSIDGSRLLSMQHGLDNNDNNNNTNNNNNNDNPSYANNCPLFTFCDHSDPPLYPPQTALPLATLQPLSPYFLQQSIHIKSLSIISFSQWYTSLFSKDCNHFLKKILPNEIISAIQTQISSEPPLNTASCPLCLQQSQLVTITVNYDTKFRKNDFNKGNTVQNQQNDIIFFSVLCDCGYFAPVYRPTFFINQLYSHVTQFFSKSHESLEQSQKIPTNLGSLILSFFVNLYYIANYLKGEMAGVDRFHWEYYSAQKQTHNPPKVHHLHYSLVPIRMENGILGDFGSVLASNNRDLNKYDHNDNTENYVSQEFYALWLFFQLVWIELTLTKNIPKNNINTIIQNHISKNIHNTSTDIHNSVNSTTRQQNIDISQLPLKIHEGIRYIAQNTNIACQVLQTPSQLVQNEKMKAILCVNGVFLIPLHLLAQCGTCGHHNESIL